MTTRGQEGCAVGLSCEDSDIDGFAGFPLRSVYCVLLPSFEVLSFQLGAMGLGALGT